MHHFEYKNEALYCEDVPVQLVADRVGTPLYLYSHATLNRHFSAFSDAFKEVDKLVCFSAKANSNMAILKLFQQLGGGLDIVSGGELFRGMQVGFPPERIVYSGVGKRIDEIDYALETGILMFNIESLEELDQINQRAAALGKKAPVAIRVNPDVDPKTHPYISTGLKKNKFGIDTQTAIEAYRTASRMENIEVKGIDCHIGSQITEVDPFRATMESLMALIRELKAFNIHIKYLDMGGGLGITYGDESPPQPAEYAQVILDAVKGTDLKLILEPGRVIVGNAGILVAKVLYRKVGQTKNFIITDAAMNDLIRPSLYRAYHHIQPVQRKDIASVKADVVGPICESGDFLAMDRDLQEMERGDLLAVMSAGAYGFVMSSNYCSRRRVPEVMVKGDEFCVIRERESYNDLIAGESIPNFI
jgi:diaminopimelate decarboxylase